MFLAVCGGGEIQIDEEWRSLESPNYPEDYEPNKECIWVLAAPLDYQVALKFQSFEVSYCTVTVKGLRDLEKTS